MSGSLRVGRNETRFFGDQIETLADSYRTYVREYHTWNRGPIEKVERVLKDYLQRADFYSDAELASIHAGRFWVIPWWTQPKRIWMEVIGQKLTGDLSLNGDSALAEIAQRLGLDLDRFQQAVGTLQRKIGQLKQFNGKHREFFSGKAFIKELMVQGLTYAFFYTQHGKEGVQEHLEVLMDRAFIYGAAYMFDELLDDNKISETMREAVEGLLEAALSDEDLDDIREPTSTLADDEADLFRDLVHYAEQLRETLKAADTLDEREKLLNVWYGFNQYQRQERELGPDHVNNYDGVYQLHILKSLYTLLAGAVLSFRDLPEEELMDWIRLAEFGQISDDIEDMRDDLEDGTRSCCTIEHAEDSLHPTQMFVNSFADMLEHYPGPLRDLYMGYTLALDISRTDPQLLDQDGIAPEFQRMHAMIESFRAGGRVERSFADKVRITSELAYSSLRHTVVAFGIAYHDKESWGAIFARAFSVVRSGMGRLVKVWTNYQAAPATREARLNIYEGVLKDRVTRQLAAMM